MKNRRSVFVEYLFRLKNQIGILITGIVGFFVTALFQLLFPSTNIRIVYLIIFVIAIVLGSYKAFETLFTDYKSLEKKLEDIENKSPNLSINFRMMDGHKTNNLELVLNPLPPKPDYDQLIKEERQNLLGQEGLIPDYFKTIPSLIFEARIPELYMPQPSSTHDPINPNYDQEVEDYLSKYKIYLIQKYELSVNRAYSIAPSIENIGQSPVSSVTVELVMPPQLKLPLKHQCFDRNSTDPKMISFTIDKPYRPERYIHSSYNGFSIPLEKDIPLVTILKDDPNVTGPELLEIEGRVYIKYQLKKLIPHLPENKFVPFWIWLGDIEQKGVLEIKVNIFAAELAKPKEDKLFFTVIKS